MTAPNETYTGRWLHHGDWHGKEFSHELAAYDHDESPGAEGRTPMRHAMVEREGGTVGVWIPADWTDDQAREALETNW